jgi:hypothetical protein
VALIEMRCAGGFVRRVVLLVGAFVAFVTQTVAVAAVAGSWVSDTNVAAGWCEYDGTCTDDGGSNAFGLGWLLLFVAELALGLLVSVVRHRRGAGGGTAGRFGPAALERTLVAVMVGCACAVAVAVQDALLIHLAAAHSSARCPASRTDCSPDQIQAILVLAWTKAALGVELGVAAVLGAVRGIRRAARRRAPATEPAGNARRGAKAGPRR